MIDLLDEALAAHLGRSLYDTINQHLADGQRAETAIERVRSLHQPVESGAPCIPDHGAPTWCPGCTDVCATCRDEDGDRVQSPCPTLQALDGEQPAPAPAATEAAGAPDTITDPAYLRDQYAAALRTRLSKVHAPGSHLEPEAVVDYIGCTEYDLADAVLRVRDRHLQQLQQRLQLADHQHLAIGAWGNAHDRATRAERQRDQLAGILREILARFEPAFPSMDQPMRYQATVPIEDRDRWRAVLDQTQKP